MRIEKFLTYESERNKENTLWIADLDKDRFYIRGIASFIKKESSIHLIERIDITAKKLLQTIYHMTFSMLCIKVCNAAFL